jgi:predicted ATP-binding protein involved in virulence
MRIKNLKIKNIGPFQSAELNFIENDEELQNPPVIIITGENGSGKTILLDAIRGLFMGLTGSIEREITAEPVFSIVSDMILHGKSISLTTHRKTNNNQNQFETNDLSFNTLFNNHDPIVRILGGHHIKKDFIVDYWTSKLSNDSFNINNITALETKHYLGNALTGIHPNADVAKSMTFFDYLKDSRDAREQKLGKTLYELLEKIINISIVDGQLSHVSRINLKPIIKIQNQELSLDKLSSGNLYLIQRYTSLLRQVYAICVSNNIPIEQYSSIQGVLLIDEAENHLHPKWQKVFLQHILKLFPQLQIIVTTHSPFIVASVENAKIFVCKSQTTHSVVEEETDLFANKPIEEILMSPLFDTNNFNEDISQLMRRRKQAVAQSNTAEIAKIEKILLAKNPEYFNYLNIEHLIQSIKK